MAAGLVAQLDQKHQNVGAGGRAFLAGGGVGRGAGAAAAAFGGSGGGSWASGCRPTWTPVRRNLRWPETKALAECTATSQLRQSSARSSTQKK